MTRKNQVDELLTRFERKGREATKEKKSKSNHEVIEEWRKVIKGDNNERNYCRSN